MDKLHFLQTQFLQDAHVIDPVKGYVVMASFNLTIDPDLLTLASSCWAEHFRKQAPKIDAIVGLPDAGSRLVSVLANMLQVPIILPSKRAVTPPGAWKNTISFQNESFTTNQDEVVSQIGFVKPGMNILVVDDVIAKGNTAEAALSALQQAGANVAGMAVLFDKVWQGGVERIEQATGVTPYSLIRVESIHPETGAISLLES